MDIDGLGTKIVELLIDNNLVKDVSDLFTLKVEDISHLERMGEKSALNIIESIEKSKSTTLARFIFGLGIRHVGQNTAKILEKYFQDDIMKLIYISKAKLLDINVPFLILTLSGASV